MKWQILKIIVDFENCIDVYRKIVARKEETLFESTLTARKNVNRNKLIAQQFQQSVAFSVANRTHSFNHVLRVLADFSYLIIYVYDDDEVKVESCFTLKDIKTRKDVFLSHLSEILDSFSKYEHLLSIIDDKVEENYQTQDKLVIDSAHLMIVFLIKSICLSFLTNKNYWLHSCSSVYWCDLSIFD